MSNITPEMAEELKRRVVANGGSVGELRGAKSVCKVCGNILMGGQFCDHKPPEPVKVRKATDRDLIKLGITPPTRSKKPLMNKTETEFHERMKFHQWIAKYQFEGVRLKIANRVHFTPDFYTVSGTTKYTESGKVTFYEVKGPYIRPDAWMKLKIAASLFPEFTFILAQRTKVKGVVTWTESIVSP